MLDEFVIWLFQSLRFSVKTLKKPKITFKMIYSILVTTIPNAA